MLTYANDRLAVNGHIVRNLADLLRLHAQSIPEQTAYISLDRDLNRTIELSYGEIHRRALAAAATIRALRSERVILVLSDPIEFIIAFFGCQYSNVVAIPVYPPSNETKAQNCARIADDAQSSLVITSSEWLGILKREVGNSTRRALLSYDDLVSNNETIRYAAEATTDRLALIQYTSGSTSTPKGVMLTHENLIHNIGLSLEVLRVRKDTCFVSWLPLYHDFGLTGSMLYSFAYGSCYVSIATEQFLRDPASWLRGIASFEDVISGGPNFAYALTAGSASRADLSGLDLSGWRAATLGGEPVVSDTLDRFARAFEPYGFSDEAFMHGYGLAESTFIVTVVVQGTGVTRLDVDSRALADGRVAVSTELSENTKTLISSGRVLRDQEFYIVDPISFTTCASDKVGEIWVRGPSVASGYWNRDELSLETFGATLENGDGPFLRTGDLGFIHDEALYIIGRIKDLIIVNGLNYYPEDVELAVWESHDDVRKGCGVAFGVEREGTERLVIIQELKSEIRSEEDISSVLSAICRALVRDQFPPPYFIGLTAKGGVPKSMNGKLRRRECHRRFLSGEFEYVGSSDSAERYLSERVGRAVSPNELVASSIRGKSRKHLYERVRLTNLFESKEPKDD